MVLSRKNLLFQRAETSWLEYTSSKQAGSNNAESNHCNGPNGNGENVWMFGGDESKVALSVHRQLKLTDEVWQQTTHNNNIKLALDYNNIGISI